MINLLHLLLAQDLAVQRRVGRQGHDFRPLVRKCHSRRNGSEWKLWKSSTHCPKVLKKLYRYKSSQLPTCMKVYVVLII